VTPDDEVRELAPTAAAPDELTRERMRAAFAKLQAELNGLVSSMEARVDERCPYRAREDRCAFAGGCANQRREAHDGERMVWCTGDHQLRRTKS